MKPRRILVVDDEPGIRQSLSGVLEDEGYAVEPSEAVRRAWRRWPGGSFELVLLDIWLPGMDGMEVLARIQEMPFAERPVVVVISGHGSIEAAVRATKLGAFDFLEKPLSIDKVPVVVKNALAHRSLELENSRLKDDTGARYRIIGESVPMKALRQQLALMAGTNGRVLIYGESGTGKELVAHAHPRDEPARRRAVRGGELRGDSRGADRERNVRPQARAASPARRKTRSASFRRPTAARSFSTRWAT